MIVSSNCLRKISDDDCLFDVADSSDSDTAQECCFNEADECFETYTTPRKRDSDSNYYMSMLFKDE